MKLDNDSSEETLDDNPILDTEFEGGESKEIAEKQSDDKDIVLKTDFSDDESDGGGESTIKVVEID